jgi:hypothetical protein
MTALSGLYGWGYLKGFSTAKDRSALLFERALTKAQQEIDTNAQKALDAAEELAAVADNRADHERVCKSDRACRGDKGQ